MTNTDIFIKKDENVSNNKINESEKIVEDCSKEKKCTVPMLKDAFLVTLASRNLIMERVSKTLQKT